MTNSSFDLGTTGVAQYNNTIGLEPFTSWGVVTGGRTGGNCLSMAWTVNNTSTKGFLLNNVNSSLLLPNMTYVVSFYARATGTNVGQAMQLAWNTAPAATVNVTNPGLTAAYQRYSFRISIGAAADPNIFFTILSGGGTNGTLVFSNIQVEEGDAATAHSPLAPGSASQLYYPTGVTLDSLRPAAAGADVTGTVLTARNIANNADQTSANTAADTSYVNGEGSSALRSRVTTAATTATWPNLTGAIPTSVDNTYAISGHNLLPNSNATQVCNWARAYSPNGSTFDVNPEFAKLHWASDSYSLGGTDMNNMVIHQSNVAPGSSDGSGDTAVACDIYPQDANSANISIPVIAGEKVFASVYLDNHRCSSFTYLAFFNSSGTPLAYVQGNVVGNASALANTLSTYARSVCGAIAPAGVAYATMFIRKLNTIAGNTESYTFWAAPQLEKTNLNQTTASPYSPGPASSVKQLGYSGDLNATLGANRRNLPQVFGGGAQLRYSVQPLSTGSATDTIYIAAHTVGDGMGTAISYGAGSIAGLAAGVNYAVYEDDPTYAGGTRTYLATTDRSVLVANSGRRWLGDIYTPASVGAATPPPTGGGAGGGAPSGNPLP